ncbi:Ubiquitin-like-specific protease [Drechslerella dactyloides]|uniref:Ubiquitin-like-specific protease n=1 Tax=Drechslerella dactyloides TaxID=74499 RepID=A0AAD6J5U3_DREDA|nr:Ubiquitin-like-specific protease [Drechslerella dactyloides]
MSATATTTTTANSVAHGLPLLHSDEKQSYSETAARKGQQDDFGIMTNLFKNLWTSLFDKLFGEGSDDGNGGNRTVDRDDVAEERQELGYTSTFEGNSRKRRRPSPADERDGPPALPALRTTSKTRSYDPSGSDRSNLSPSDRRTPSTNPTEPQSDNLKSASILDYTESKWRERSETPIFGTVRTGPALDGSQQLKRSLARRNQATQPQGNPLLRLSISSHDRVSKRSSTPSSMRSSRARRSSLTPWKSRATEDPSFQFFPDPSQYSPPSERLPYQSALRMSTGASSYRATGFRASTTATPSRSSRLQASINESARKKATPKKPWLLQKDPGALVNDAESLAILIRQLQENHVEGFEMYSQVQERQKKVAEQIREMQAPKSRAEVLRDISEDSLAELHRFLLNRNQNHEARLIGGCPITPRNLKTLSGSQWLNDEVINAYIHLIKERANSDGKTHLILLNSMFVTTFKDNGYSRVARWAKRAGAGGDKILQLDGVIVPIHRNYHWTLAFINVAQKRFEYYDSLAGHWDPIRLLRDYMRQEVGAGYVDADWSDYYPGDQTPQQGNGVDCGVFLCKTAEVICRDGMLSFSQKDIPKIRRMMQVELLQADLAAV